MYHGSPYQTRITVIIEAEDFTARVSSVRIAFVSTELLPIYGNGALERLVIGWAKLIKEKHDVVLVSVSPALSGGVSKVGHLPHLYINNYTDLSNLCEEHRIELCIVNNRPGWLGSIRTKSAVILHNFSSAWELDQFPVNEIPSSSGVVALSHPLFVHANEVLHPKNEQLHHIFPYLASAFLEAKVAQVKDDSDQLRYLFPNRLMYKKGVWALLDALDLLHDSEVHVDLTLSRSPSVRDRNFTQKVLARIKASPNARAIPPLTTPKEVAEAMSRYSGVLMPSVEPEGFGLVAYESLALGIPTVTSNLGGLSHATELGATAVDPLHTPKFARVLLELNRSPSYINRDFIVETFRVERSAQDLLDRLL